jgi:ribonuclease HI
MNYYCDGSLKEICVTNDNGEVFIEQIEGTNNENEYRSMILALEKAKDNDMVFADSQLIVNQLTKGWKVKAQHLYGLYAKAMNLLKEKKITIEWVSRDFNRAGWILEGRTGNYKKEKFELLK